MPGRDQTLRTDDLSAFERRDRAVDDLASSDGSSVSDRVLQALEAGVLTATLNRPEERNALDEAMLDALDDLLTTAELDRTVRVLAVRGAGPDFSTGMDLAESLESADRASNGSRAGATRFAEILLRMRQMPKPVVALVGGRAAGWGAGLALASDLVLARESASFAFPEIAGGFVPALVLALLHRAAGEKRAFELAATGRVLTAREAMALGLCSRVYPDAEFDPEAAGVLGVLVSGSASGLAILKKELYALEGRPIESGLGLGTDVNAFARTLPEFEAGLAAFLKR